MTVTLRRMKSVFSTFGRLATVITLAARRSLQRSGNSSKKSKSANISTMKAHISFLPNELLSYIILEYALEMDIFSKKWAPILLICRRWHDVARAHAQLWSYVSDRQSPEHFWGLVRRSGVYPLTCEFSHVGIDNGLLGMFLNTGGLAHRVRSLRIECLAPILEDAIPDVVDLPSLQSLEYADAMSEWNTETRSTLLDVLLDGRAPRLHRVVISAISQFTKWTMLSNLTVLSVHRHEHLDRFSLQDIVSSLQRAPRLRELTLNRCLPEMDAHNTFIESLVLDIRPTTLSYLETLRVVDTRCFPIDALLRCVVLPPTTSLCIKMSAFSDEIPVFIRLLMQVRQHLQKPGAPVLRLLTVKGGPPGPLDGFVSVSAAVTRMCDQSVTNPFADESVSHVFLSVVTNLGEPAKRAMLTHMLDAFPLDHVSDLAALVKLDWHTFKSKTWAAVFRRIPRLETTWIVLGPGMANVLKGLFDAVQRSAYGLGRKRRRLGSHGPIVRPHRIFFTRPDFPPTNAYHDELWGLLAAYQAMDAPSKSTGVAWPLVEMAEDLFDDNDDTLYGHRARLLSVVQNLVIGGKMWCLREENRNGDHHKGPSPAVDCSLLGGSNSGNTWDMTDAMFAIDVLLTF
ncbi:hypothetical protein BV25DRAFT_840752 [Artomyces pyxidatus]|uniref:Uncharacterized protein n=1 Tax=Artomyces pyxidatus TaxID=48021 RepID=A0ACB8TGS3_9AGAM|nr:hypothetical protein BV25DRAFT_840752 [Artomyces pyxidatus]